MSKNKRESISCDYYNSQDCNNIANQYLILVTIYSAIISQEIEDDEALGILGSFLVALGEEISLASEIRIACKARFEDESNLTGEVEDIFDRSSFKNQNQRRGRKKYIKKIKKKHSKIKK